MAKKDTLIKSQKAFDFLVRFRIYLFRSFLSSAFSSFSKTIADNPDRMP